MKLDKLESIFAEKYRDLNEELWIDYCDRHKIKIMHPEWVKECFNEDAKGVVCIFSPENEWWILVPKKLAERAVVLGYLP